MTKAQYESEKAAIDSRYEAAIEPAKNARAEEMSHLQWAWEKFGEKLPGPVVPQTAPVSRMKDLLEEDATDAELIDEAAGSLRQFNADQILEFIKKTHSRAIRRDATIQYFSRQIAEKKLIVLRKGVRGSPQIYGLPGELLLEGFFANKHAKAGE